MFCVEEKEKAIKFLFSPCPESICLLRERREIENEAVFAARCDAMVRYRGKVTP